MTATTNVTVESEGGTVNPPGSPLAGSTVARNSPEPRDDSAPGDSGGVRLPQGMPAAAISDQLEPGIYDMPDADYHARPELSNTEARRILDCPAKYTWFKQHQQYKQVFEFGHAAHLAVLGTGAAIVVCDFDDWRTKDARAARDEARADGKSPVLTHEWATVQLMVDALKAHPIACRLLTAEGGRSEQSMFWSDRDPWTDRVTALRGRLDRLPAIPTTSGRLIVADYKTAASAASDAFSRSAANYGYHQQSAWYLDGIRALLGVDDPAFVFVVQERDAPYLVNVIELDTTALTIGRDRNRAAIDKFNECRDNNRWPGYSDEVELVGLPRWAEIQAEQEQSA